MREVPKHCFDLHDCSVVRETPRAVLVRAEALPDGEAWIPKSCIDDDSEVFALGHAGTMLVSKWFAEQSGWL